MSENASITPVDAIRPLFPNDEPIPETGAIISPCETYRYRLWRRWDASKATCAFVMLNPSTADATADDPTIRKCIGFAKRWGFGGFTVVNLFAWRETNPHLLRGMRQNRNIIGPENNEHIAEVTASHGATIVAWGAHPAAQIDDRAAEVCDIITASYADVTLMCIGTTASGEPRHPLMTAYAVPLVPYRRSYL